VSSPAIRTLLEAIREAHSDLVPEIEGVMPVIRPHGEAVTLDWINACRTLYDFDDVFTAPLHGFRNADDYWDRGSSLAWLRHIKLPTLIINARNDPFMPLTALPAPLVVSPAVTLELPEHGGHVGFMRGPWPGDQTWLPRRLLDYFDEHRPGPRA